MKSAVGFYLVVCASRFFGQAFACPDGQVSLGFACVPDPTHFPAPPVPPGLPNPAGTILDPHEQTVQVAGTALEHWLQQSRNSSIGTSQPIPDFIRNQLRGYIADDVMDIAHFKIGDTGFFNLPGISVRYGDARAMTAIDVIVFDNADDARDPALWAHELTHVKQYRDWGAHSFAIQYARNWHAVEDPAYAVQNGFGPWQEAQNAPLTIGTGSNPAPRPAPPPPPPTGNFCQTPIGRFGPGPTDIVGNVCHVDGPQGPILGHVSP